MVIRQCRIWIPPWEVILYYYVTSVQVFIIHPGGGRITDNLCIDDSHLNNLRSYLYLRRHQTTPIFIAPHISPPPPAVLAYIREHISCSLFISLAACSVVIVRLIPSEPIGRTDCTNMTFQTDWLVVMSWLVVGRLQIRKKQQGPAMKFASTIMYFTCLTWSYLGHS